MTSPIPLLIFIVALAFTLQCSVTVPLVGNVAGLTANERICGGAAGTSWARKNPYEFDCSAIVKFDCPGVARRYGVQGDELFRLVRRSTWYTRSFAELRIDT